MSTFESEVASTGAEVALAREVPGRSVAGWVLYDLANTIFSMGIVSMLFPVLVRNAVGTEVDKTVSTWITSVSMAVIFVVSPLLGAMTDRARRRMPFLITSTVTCVLFTLMMPRFDFTVAAICFIIANIAYQAGLQFYDALLPEVSNESNRGRIGGIGVGVGYLGSFMAVGLTFLLRDEAGATDLPLAVTVIAVLFMLFAVPCFLFVRERGNPNPRPITFGTIGESTRQTLKTLRSTQQYPGLVRFLIGRMFYTDAINTVIIVMFLYTIDVAVMTGRTEAEGSAAAQLVMLTAISFAVVGGFVWGSMADRLGPKRTLNLVLYLWMFVFTFAAAVGILGLPIWTLYVVACSAGVGMGGIWAADRPYMLRLTPPARIGEFYGLYGMVGRFSAIMGPLIFGGIVWLALRVLPEGQAAARSARASGLGVLMLLSFIIVSYVILQKVSDTKRVWTGADLGDGGAATGLRH